VNAVCTHGQSYVHPIVDYQLNPSRDGGSSVFVKLQSRHMLFAKLNECRAAEAQQTDLIGV
jgi:hypothetical protein